ncbi:hypothetical protein RDI58_017646 [Solanum bulbocastanum]|uniref:Reverse transcriptase domain-containing protein n=1 Tax=Solanum bulbocastanum TaxID=147425 RepID=A0AAN8TFU5_SOLBU
MSHLLFVDKTLVFCDAIETQPNYLGQILTWFQAVSRLQINLRKCEIFFVGEVNYIGLLAQVLNCKVGGLPTTYLVVLLGPSNKDGTMWNPAI